MMREGKGMGDLELVGSKKYLKHSSSLVTILIILVLLVMWVWLV